MSIGHILCNNNNNNNGMNICFRSYLGSICVT